MIENKPGGGSMLAANTVYNSEPRDGTVIAAFSGDIVLQQALGAQGVQFDAASSASRSTVLKESQDHDP